MMMRIGECCKLCNIIFKDSKKALQHFIDKHSDVAMINLSNFIVTKQYMDAEHDAPCVEDEQ